jgi:hypothetical protein
MVTRKAGREEQPALSGKVTSPVPAYTFTCRFGVRLHV